MRFAGRRWDPERFDSAGQDPVASLFGFCEPTVAVAFLTVPLLIALLAVFPACSTKQSDVKLPKMTAAGPDANGESDASAQDESQTEANDETAPQGDGLDAAAVLLLTQEKWDTIEDYHAVSRVYNRMGDEVDEKQLDIAFKRPLLVRNTVIEGANQGGTATLNAENVIHGKRGGALGLLVITLEDDDERIRGIRGRKFYEAGWGSEIGEFTGRVDAGWQFERLADKTVDEADCYALAVSGESDESAVTREEMWIEKETRLLKRRRLYEGDVLVRDVIYTVLGVNESPDDGEFSLK